MYVYIYKTIKLKINYIEYFIYCIYNITEIQNYMHMYIYLYNKI